MVQAWGVWDLRRPEGHRGDSAEPVTCSPGPLGEERGTRLENHGRPLPQDQAPPLPPRLSPACRLLLGTHTAPPPHGAARRTAASGSAVSLPSFSSGLLNGKERV